MCCSPHGKNLSGESILAILALIGGFALSWHGSLKTMHDIWMFVGLLAVVVVFYFFVLLCRAIYSFMAGHGGFWWEKYEAQKPMKK